eukprot:CAMPEP_0196656120 /NCGR_PEP_ID=MMETSP1086-20130531/13605_1 /TAXON_ID=77921 /ORGANISM="Cyanoptyche  gloeocystis , Strain SAG4.97" /LENGTH=123 /DNA_ID=CAMNT_0041988741 /DNA_START=40 /DNA_END=407 /DNA_ORIENTATION=-
MAVAEVPHSSSQEFVRLKENVQCGRLTLANMAAHQENARHPISVSSPEQISLSDNEQSHELLPSTPRKRSSAVRTDAITRRRENHRNQEQHRREKINENLTQLRALLEPSTMARCNKANILKT